MRVIADHLRGATFLAVDGVRPSNKAQGYVMRRLIRRAVRYAFDLGLRAELLPADHPDHRRHLRRTTTRRSPSAPTTSIAVLVKEEKAFRRTLRKGIKQLRGYRKTGITGAELFTLYDTFGFPVELSTEEARAAGHRRQRRLAGRVRRADGRAAGPVAAGDEGRGA